MSLFKRFKYILWTFIFLSIFVPPIHFTVLGYNIARSSDDDLEVDEGEGPTMIRVIKNLRSFLEKSLGELNGIHKDIEKKTKDKEVETEKLKEKIENDVQSCKDKCNQVGRDKIQQTIVTKDDPLEDYDVNYDETLHEQCNPATGENCAPSNENVKRKSAEIRSPKQHADDSVAELSNSFTDISSIWGDWSKWSECNTNDLGERRQIRYRKCIKKKCEADYEIHERICEEDQ